MDAVFVAADGGGRGSERAVPHLGGELRTERGPGGDDEDVMCEEQELRRVTQTEHGEPAVARDEADGEHAAGDIPVTPIAGRRAGYLRFAYRFGRVGYRLATGR